ncbi:MAG: phenylalanine--tRNA ligase beta subunit-related protein, partial [Candidatus Omnitrophota bacterium]
MKLSYEWLREYVKVEAGCEEVARGLTMSGSEVGHIEDKDGDKVMELEITSNRPDCLNVIGLAREVSAVFDADLRLPESDIAAGQSSAGITGIKCVVKNKELCPRYTARVITGVRVKGSAGSIRERVLAMGMRPVNNVADITNY